MTGFETSDNAEMCDFTYNDQNQLIDMHVWYPGSDDYHDSIRYDANGNLVRIDTYQLLNGEFTHVCYLEYTYDELGRITSRMNYNHFSDWELGGVYSYSYDPEGHLVQSDLTMGGSLFTTIEYTYTDGLLVEELWSNADFYTSALTPSEKIEYNYTNGKLTQTVTSTYDEGVWSLFSSESFEYDNNGNCTQHQTLDEYGNTTSKSVYVFMSTLVENTLIPSTPEGGRPIVYTNRNNYMTEEWYTLDDNGELQYVCDYIYSYDGNVAVEEHDNFGTMSAFPNPSNGVITISFDKAQEGSTLLVHDIYGRLVKSENVTEGNLSLDLTNCCSGTYILSLVSEGKLLQTKKISVTQ